MVMKNSASLSRFVASLELWRRPSSWARPAVPGPPGSHGTAEAVPIFADGALDGYLPPDAGAVYTLNLRQALATPAGRRLAAPLRRFLEGERTVRPWLDSLGADPIKDVELDAIHLLRRRTWISRWCC